MLSSVDAVHGAYYFIMFVWSRAFGFSEASLRFPSIMAVVATSFLIVELGKKIAGVHLGVLASVLLLLLPRTQYAATDGRSYALTILGAVAATYVLVSIRERSRSYKWVVYAVIGLVTVSLSFYTVFLLASHALTLIWDQRLRSQWLGMISAATAWLAPAVYIGVAASQQQFQISWIREVGPAFPYEIAFLQFFADGYFSVDGQVFPAPTPGEDFTMLALAFLCWPLAIACAVLFRRHFLVRLALPWLLVPTIAVVAASLILGGNYYLPRYLTFVLPAMAFLAALPLASALLSRSFGRAAKPALMMTAAAVLGLCLPSYLGQRTQYGRDIQDDFRFIATSVERLANRGDCFVMNSDVDLALQAYPQSFQYLVDPTIGLTAAQWRRIFNQRFDISSSAAKIALCPAVVLVEKADKSEMASALHGLGYSGGHSERGTSTRVTRFSRE